MQQHLPIETPEHIHLLGERGIILRRAARLLDEGRKTEAATLLDDTWPPQAPASRRPPRVDLLRARLRLLDGDAAGVTRAFAAAERDPALLGEAATIVEQWLDGPGAAHDDMLLRQELLRMQALHANAHREREETSGRDPLRQPPEELITAVRAVLAARQDDIRAAWLAERACRQAPRWRHFEVLLELKPRSWHFRADAEERLRREAHMLQDMLAPAFGTLQVRLHPLLALPAHVRNMRANAHALFGEPSRSPDDATPAGSSDAADVAMTGHDAATTPQRLHPVLRSSLLATLLVLPLWAGWSMVSNEQTREQLTRMEQRHAALLRQRWWRNEAAAAPFAPRQTVQAFLAAVRAGERAAHLPVLDTASRRAMLSPHRAAADWRACDASRTRIAVSQGHAVALWPRAQRFCMPLLLRREQGRWRVALRDTRAAFQLDFHGQWHFANDDGTPPKGWEFAFDTPAERLVGETRSHPADAEPPHGENGASLRTSRLEHTPATGQSAGQSLGNDS